MTDEEYMEAAAMLGRAAARAVDDVYAEALALGLPFQVTAAKMLDRAERFDALMNPQKASDYGQSLTAEEFKAELAARGMAPPAWWPGF